MIFVISRIPMLSFEMRISIQLDSYSPVVLTFPILEWLTRLRRFFTIPHQLLIEYLDLHRALEGIPSIKRYAFAPVASSTDQSNFRFWILPTALILLPCSLRSGKPGMY